MLLQQKIHRIRAKPNAEVEIFRVQSSTFILVYAVEYIKHTHQFSSMIRIQIDRIVALNEWNSTPQK